MACGAAPRSHRGDLIFSIRLSTDRLVGIQICGALAATEFCRFDDYRHRHGGIRAYSVPVAWVDDCYYCRGDAAAADLDLLGRSDTRAHPQRAPQLRGLLDRTDRALFRIRVESA